MLALNLWVDELDALLAISPLRLLVWLALVVGVVWLLAVAIPLAVRVAWQLGLDVRRRLALASTLARITAPFVGVVGALEPFFTRAPAISLIGLFALASLALLASPSSARNLAAGLGLALHARVRPGDLIRIGEIEGKVDDVGLMRVRLRTREGGVTMIPSADFERLPVTVGSHAATVPIEVEFEAGPAIDEATLERLRRALWFSPFRRAGSEVRLTRELGSERVRVAIDTWAPRASVELERHVRELLRRALDPGLLSPGAGEPSDDEEAT